MDEAASKARIIDLDFHERTVERVAAALAKLALGPPMTHYGLGQAKVERVASNRRVVDAERQGRVRP